MNNDAHQHNIEIQTLLRVTEKINEGITLNEVLDYTYEAFKGIIPYNRMSLALIEENQTIRTYWVRAEYSDVVIKKGYRGGLQGSSLQAILESNQPRIINDLQEYLKSNPDSEATKNILREKVRSSLTCPLIALGKPIGFLFFSSQLPNTYENMHVDLFLEIAGQLAVIAEKSRLYEQLVELNDLKNKFIGIAAHDLRSPLSVINSNLELLLGEYLGDINSKQRESIDMMHQWCQRMLTLIKNLLSVSSIESGQLQLTCESINAEAFLQKEFDFNQLLAKAKDINLELEIVGTLPELSIDTTRMSQVLNNLITNAIKFSQRNTTITIKAHEQGNDVHIAVIDQGQGIPAKEIPKLFEFFSRTTVKPTGGESSTGIGLAIVKSIVEAHGGCVVIESEVGKGSVFTCILPVKKSV